MLGMPGNEKKQKIVLNETPQLFELRSLRVRNRPLFLGLGHRVQMFTLFALLPRLPDKRQPFFLGWSRKINIFADCAA